MKKQSKPKPAPKSKKAVKRRGAPLAGTKQRKALDALYKSYNRPKDNGDDD